MHCAHRNPSTPPSYTEAMLITDSVVHEFDSVPWLAGERIVSVEVKKPRRNSLAPAGLGEPQLVLIELESGAIASVEINVNVQFGYQVTTEAVMERGVAEIGRTAGLEVWRDGRWGGAEHVTFKTRFGAAFDAQVQRWVDAVASRGDRRRKRLGRLPGRGCLRGRRGRAARRASESRSRPSRGPTSTPHAAAAVGR